MITQKGTSVYLLHFVKFLPVVKASTDCECRAVVASPGRCC